jgi:hypothetical protein
LDARRGLPITVLEGRLKCLACGSRRVALLFDLPGRPMAKATREPGEVSHVAGVVAKNIAK